jgi:drug/metabolite transporter (DMT)-like permease
MRKRDRVALSALLACAAIAGGNGVGIRYSNRELAPLWGASIRFGTAACILLVLMLTLRLELPRGRALLGAVLFGVLNFAFGFGVFYVALLEIQAGLGHILLALVPLLTLLLAVVWRQEKLGFTAILAVIVAVGGVGVMSQAPLRQVPVWALLAGLVSAVALAQAAVVVRRFPMVHPVTMNTVGMAAAIVALLAASLFIGEEWVVPTEAATLVAMGYLILAGSVLVFLLYLVVLRHWHASRAAYVFVLSPFVAVVLSAWLDDEPVGVGLVVGGLLVLAGVYLGALRRAEWRVSDHRLVISERSSHH